MLTQVLNNSTNSYSRPQYQTLQTEGPRQTGLHGIFFLNSKLISKQASKLAKQTQVVISMRGIKRTVDGGPQGVQDSSSQKVKVSLRNGGWKGVTIGDAGKGAVSQPWHY